MALYVQQMKSGLLELSGTPATTDLMLFVVERLVLICMVKVVGHHPRNDRGQV